MQWGPMGSLTALQIVAAAAFANSMQAMNLHLHCRLVLIRRHAHRLERLLDVWATSYNHHLGEAHRARIRLEARCHALGISPMTCDLPAVSQAFICS
jgi:hypothetical protein